MLEEDDIERHPFGYPWRERFPDAERVAGFEGGALYRATGEGAYWLITDEGTLADLLDPVDDADILSRLVSLRRYETARELESELAERRERRARAEET